jgi:hypothetical protein
MTNQHPQDEPTITLARDEFTARRRELDGHPEAVTASSRIDVVSVYGEVTTWVLDLYRVAGDVTAFVQRGGTAGYQRFVMPPQVTAAITRHQAGLVTKSRRRTAKRVMADRVARGEKVGNPEAFKQHRRKAKAEAKKAEAAS